MARGQKTEYEQLVLVMSDYFITRSYTATAKNLDMPRTTVQSLVEAHYNDKEFIELRHKKEEEFVERANHLIFKSMNIMNNELDTMENIPINQLTTAIGTLYDKKMMAQTGIMGNDTPSVQINIVNNEQLEEALYSEDENE